VASPLSSAKAIRSCKQACIAAVFLIREAQSPNAHPRWLYKRVLGFQVVAYTLFVAWTLYINPKDLLHFYFSFILMLMKTPAGISNLDSASTVF
jgi:hypothetical protein